MEEPYAYVHTLPSLDAYPRVRFFYRNFNSLVPRFKRVAGSLPTCFHDISLNKELDDTLELMKSGIHVTVFGHEDIDRNKFVISTSGQETENVEIFPKIDVCYVKTNGVAHSNVGEVWSLIDRWIKRGRNTNWNLVFLCCEITTLPSNRDVDNFKSTILKELLVHGIELLPSNITVSTHVDVNIAEHISNFLEAFVIQGFVKINNHLDRFVLERLSTTHNQNLIKQENITQLLKDILTPATLDDLGSIQLDTNVTKENQSNMKTDRNIVLAVPRVVKCLIVPTLAERFNMSLQDCNLLICDHTCVNFENKLYDAIKLEPDSGVNASCKYITSQVGSALPRLISDIESEFQRTKRVVSMMRKMKYEVHGYLKQTKIPLNCKPRPVAPKIPDGLKKAIRSVPGVFGLGTFYGQIEIHLDPTSTVSDNSAEHIRQWMDKYQFRFPYLIKYVTKKPKAFSPGSKLHVISPIKKTKPNGGTLGGYITDKNQKVYALTCAHVVGHSEKAKVFVCTNGGMEPLSVRQHCSSCGSCNDFPLIDIAAAHILDTNQNTCMHYLRNSNGHVQQVRVTNRIIEELVGDRVLKFGAYSGKTYGTIGAVDYELFGPDAGEYVISFDPLPDLMQDDPLSRAVDDELEHSVDNVDPTVNGAYGIGPSRLNTGGSGYEHGEPEQIVEVQPSGNVEMIYRRVSAFNVYVRNPGEYNDADMECGIFAKRGDSGSIVCSHELSGHSEECAAISMVSAGEFSTRGQDNNEVDEDDEDISFGFKLHPGLEKLQERLNINLM